MKIIIAPNALKGCLTAAAAAAALARGAARASPDSDIMQVPVADGGDGLAEVLVSVGQQVAPGQLLLRFAAPAKEVDAQ